MPEEMTDLIDEFILGRLKGQSLHAFEQRLEQEPDFASRVEERRTLIQQVDAYGDYTLKQRLKRIHQQEVKQNKRTRSIRRWTLIAAALIPLALGTLLWLGPANSPADLYSAHYTPYVLDQNLRSNTNDTALSEAIQRYNSGDYRQALPLLQTLWAADNDQSEVRLAIGICQMELNQDAAALESFQDLWSKDFDPFAEQARWYSALIHLRQEAPEEAKKQLRFLLEDQGSPYFQKAQQLLEEL